VSTNGGGSFANIGGATSVPRSFTANAGENGNEYRAVFTNVTDISRSATTTAATLTVVAPPAFTSSSTTTFVPGTSGSFTVTTSGLPTVTAISESGTLPAGLSYVDNGDGTATLSGAPDAGSGGTYPVTLDATNGITPDGTQLLTIQVNEAPAITLNPSSQTVNPGTVVTFTAAASGVPAPTVQWQESEDGDGTWVDVGGATTTSLSFLTKVQQDGDEFRAVFTNSVDTATTTAATLRVGTAPAFTSDNATTFSVGSPGSFTVTTSGVPDAVVTSTTLPPWATLTDNGDGTATLSGTPPTGSGGTYSFTITAGNGFSPQATQPFTLSVDESPTVTSADHTTFTVGTLGLFVVTTNAGFPVATGVTETGALPSGVTLVDNGDGSATLSGTPSAGTAGVYPITITATATDGATTPTAQSFTLTVNGPPTITSADHTTFTVGALGSFTVHTTAGQPTSTFIAESGALPSGVTFTNNGDGTATLTGTPVAGTGGSYPITITAGNGIAPAASQIFTLTVIESPVITSSDHTQFTVGTAGSFTVTTASANPTPTITETGALPTGMTFIDNGDGTATLAGTPAAGTAAAYQITITASNGVPPAGTQTFTMTVAKVGQTISVTSTPPTPALVGGTYPLSATASSALGVTFSIDAATTNSACSLAATTVDFDNPGSCVVDFDQIGDGTFAAAPQLQQTISVTSVPTTVSVVTSPTSSVFGQPVTATASVSATVGTPTGSVQFAIDGSALGAPITVSGGTASVALTDVVGNPLAPGSHSLVATFTPDDTVTYSVGTDTVSHVVSQAATTTGVVVNATSLVATVAPVAPGAGTPTGSVAFTVGGKSVGRAPLSGSTATLTYTTKPGMTQHVAATYSGDADFAGSSASTSRSDPTLTATVKSAHAKTRFGWYRTAVTVTFHCVANGAPLTSPCPTAVTLTHNGGGQSVTRTITATDGGAATVAVRGINIDETPPTVRVTGVRNGATYFGVVPVAHCVARDGLSGVASCTITRHTHGTLTTYTATARDKAGNVATVSGSYRTLGITLTGAPFRDGSFVVRTGRTGHTYTLVVHASTRPTYYDAAQYPMIPYRRDQGMFAAGHNRWILGITMLPELRSHSLWNLGIKVGPTMHVIRIRVVGAR
jgi:hypothetical protein